MNRYPPIALLLALQACAPTAPVVSACAPEALSGYIGADRAALSALTFTGPLRWVLPDGRLTADYNPQRLNVQLDDNGVITRMYCG